MAMHKNKERKSDFFFRKEEWMKKKNESKNEKLMCYGMQIKYNPAIIHYTLQFKRTKSILLSYREQENGARAMSVWREKDQQQQKWKKKKKTRKKVVTVFIT